MQETRKELYVDRIYICKIGEVVGWNIGLYYLLMLAFTAIATMEIKTIILMQNIPVSFHERMWTSHE